MNVTFHKAQTSQTIDVAPGTTMAGVRTNLGSFMASVDRFLYYDAVEERNFTLSLEKEIKFSIENLLKINGRGDKITIAVEGGTSKDFSGIKTDWFTYESTMQVKMVLNNRTEELAAINKNKIEPIMIDQVRSVNRNFEKAYTKAILCEKGSIVKFDISAWAAAGYKFELRTGNSFISKGRYKTTGPDKTNRILDTTIASYSSSGKTIVIDDFTSLAEITGLITDDVYQFAEVRIRAWLLSAYTKNGIRVESHQKPPLNKNGRSNDPLARL